MRQYGTQSGGGMRRLQPEAQSKSDLENRSNGEIDLDLGF